MTFKDGNTEAYKELIIDKIKQVKADIVKVDSENMALEIDAEMYRRIGEQDSAKKSLTNRDLNIQRIAAFEAQLQALEDMKREIKDQIARNSDM